MNGTVILFDDAVASDWMPFALTRPVGNLLFGAFTFAERAQSVLDMPCAGHISAARLRGFDEAGCTPVIDPATISTDRVRLYLSSRTVLDWSARVEAPTRAVRVLVGGEPVGWLAPAGSPGPPAEFFDDPRSASLPDGGDIELPGRVIETFWQMMTENIDQIARDWIGTARRVRSRNPGPDASVVYVGGHVQSRAPMPYELVGGEPKLLRVDPAGVAIEPYVLFDVSSGPIWIEAGVTIRAFTRLAGPAFIGRATTLLGGSISGSSIGPRCKVHGEVEASVMIGFTNKAHDGFLGHAYVGRWVNLGALTTNSDLKNNYGSVRLHTPRGEVDTGSRKIGCFLGDHVKTAIGTMLSTGTVVGAGANLFGDVAPPRYVEPFAWGNAGNAVYDVQRFLATAEIAMSRRDVPLSPGLRDALERAWREAAGTRGEDAS